MRGFQPAKAKAKAQAFANGGPVRGPGTGTSDEIEDVLPKGTYVMPADTTAAVGAQALAGMGASSVPVKLSNGEFKMPPEQVHAVGVQALDQLKNATHAPVGFAPGVQQGQQGQEPEPRMFFADGGVVAAGSSPAFRRQNVNLGEWAQQQDQERNARSRKNLAQAAASEEQDQANASAATAREAASATPSPNQTSPSNIFPQSSPAAGAPIYQGAGFSAGQLGSSGQFAQVPASIGQQPGRQPASSAPDSQQGAGAVGFSPARQAHRPPDPVTGATPAPQVQQVMTGVFRSGNSYGDSAAVGVPGAAPAAQVAPQSSALAAQPAADPQQDMAAFGFNPNVARQAERAPGAIAAPPTPDPMRADAAKAPATLYMQDRAQEMRGQIGTGNYAGAAGTAARTAVQGLGMYGLDIANALVNPVLDVGGRMVGGLLGTDTPGGQVRADAAAPTARPGTAAAGAGRGTVSPAAVNPSAPAPVVQSQAQQVINGVYEHGRGQYSDQAGGMGFARGFTGQPNEQNLRAAENLVNQSVGFQPGGTQPSAPAQISAPSVQHSGNSWQARNDLRNAQVSANSITNDGGRWDQHRGASASRGFAAAMEGADFAARGAQTGMDQAAMRENAGLQREGMQQAGETDRTAMREAGEAGRASTRNALDARRLGIEEQVRGFDIRAGQRQEKLHQQYESAKTPEARAAIVRQIRDLSGKTESVKDNFMPLGGGQEWDAAAGTMRNVPQRLVDLRTGLEIGGGQRAPAAGPAQPTNKAEYDALPKGATYTRNGVTYTKG